MKVTECTLLSKKFRLFLKNKLQEYGVSEPDLIFSGRRTTCYYPIRKLISIGEAEKRRSLKESVLHEVTHHIKDEKYEKEGRFHSKKFFEILLDLVKNSHTRYNWRGEYRTIRKMYKHRNKISISPDPKRRGRRNKMSKAMMGKKASRRIKVYLNEGCLDEYAVIIGKDVYAMSKNPSSKRGYNEEAGSKREWAFDENKRVAFEKLPKKVREAIIQRGG